MTQCEGCSGPSGIELHMRLEAELRRVRQLRDAGDPGFRPEAEEALLDEMEKVWYLLSPEQRTLLEDWRKSEAKER